VDCSWFAVASFPSHRGHHHEIAFSRYRSSSALCRLRGADVHKKQLLILFDDAGRVKKFTFSDSVDELKAGLLG
jgi:hypothetical protein